MAKKYCCFANMCDNETKYLATEEWIEKFTASRPLAETKEKNENPKLGRKKKSDSKWSDI